MKLITTLIFISTFLLLSWMAISGQLRLHEHTQNLNNDFNHEVQNTAPFDQSPSHSSTTNSNTLQTSVQSEKEVKVRMFHEFYQCHAASARIRNIKKMEDACNQALTYGPDKVCEKNIQELNEKLQEIQAQFVNCNPVPAELERLYYESVMQAAKLGDSDAQVCYIKGSFQTVLNEEDLQRYRLDAASYANNGLMRGDWRVVKLLGTSSNVLGHAGTGLLSSLPIGNPIEVYRMNRLLHLGATGEYASLLDTYAKDSSVKLSPEQIAKAENWAQQEYNNYFKNSANLSSAPEVCSDMTNLNINVDNQ
jgi:hypothetical protein